MPHFAQSSLKEGPRGVSMSQIQSSPPLLRGSASVPDRDAAVAAAFDTTLAPMWRAGWYRNGFKRLLDVTLVLLALPVVLPVIALAAAALWVEGGQPFFGQKRLGRNGRVFVMRKLRTMVPDAEARLERCLVADPALRHEWETTQKLRRDPRITPLGRFLRKSSLDELPQLWNVLTGDMSLVGPRPMLPHQLDLYGGDTSAYFALRPGLTGLWQISERNQGYFARRAICDARYDRSLSLPLDLRVIAATFRVMLRGTGC